MLAGELQVQPEHRPALLLASEIDSRTDHARIESVVTAVPGNDDQFAAALAQEWGKALGWLNSIVEMEELPEASAAAAPRLPGLTALGETLNSLWKSLPSGAENDWALEVYTRCRIARDELQISVPATRVRHPGQASLAYAALSSRGCL
jgi:hypothetical protein